MTSKQNYSLMMPCTLVGNQGPMCPAGWTSVGYTQPGSCAIGNPPGDGPRDLWQLRGYNRVCKKSVESSGDLGVDCCVNVDGVGNSVECRSRGFVPYSDTCNALMTKKCNSNVMPSPYGPQWNGMPFGQETPAFDGCTGKTRIAGAKPARGKLDGLCVSYLENAPAGNFYRNHDFKEYPHHFPRHSYTTPAFAGSFGYQPTRMGYHPWNEYDHRNRNSFNKTAQ